MSGISDKNLRLELASYKDMFKIYSLRNESEARNNSLNSSKIKLHRHIIWFLKNKKNNNEIIYIVKSAHKKIGYLRIKKEKECGRISYCIDKKYRGQGYGTHMIIMLENLHELDLKQIQAVVKKENTASIIVFRKLKYIEEDCDQYLLFHKEIKK